MNPSAARVATLSETGSKRRRRGGAPGVLLALLILLLLASATLMVHPGADGAAPAATLSVISETFDKGF
jgi:hypothetical protein